MTKLNEYNKFKKLYESGLSITKIAKLFKCHPDTIRIRLKELGVKLKKGRPFNSFTKKYPNIIAQYQSGETVRSLAKIYNCSFQNIWKLLKDRGQEMPNRGNSKNKERKFNNEKNIK